MQVWGDEIGPLFLVPPNLHILPETTNFKKQNRMITRSGKYFRVKAVCLQWSCVLHRVNVETWIVVQHKTPIKLEDVPDGTIVVTHDEMYSRRARHFRERHGNNLVFGACKDHGLECEDCGFISWQHSDYCYNCLHTIGTPVEPEFDYVMK